MKDRRVTQICSSDVFNLRFVVSKVETEIVEREDSRFSANPFLAMHGCSENIDACGSSITEIPVGIEIRMPGIVSSF